MAETSPGWRAQIAPARSNGSTPDFRLPIRERPSASIDSSSRVFVHREPVGGFGPDASYWAEASVRFWRRGPALRIDPARERQAAA